MQCIELMAATEVAGWQDVPREVLFAGPGESVLTP